MAIKRIITPKNSILRKKARPITDFDNPKLQRLIDDMVTTMLEAPGVGLAAPQVAVSQRLIVVHLPDDEQSQEEYGDDAGVLHVVINPEITHTSGDIVEGMEGCLSIPGYFGNVKRPQLATIKGYDRHGKPLHVDAEGWLARVFQHEVDHLDGVLFIDRTTDVWRVKDAVESEDPLEFEQEFGKLLLD